MRPATRVVIVDDDEAVRLRLTDLLTRLGSFSIQEAVDGPSGLALVERMQPDIVLLDIMMPGMTGLEVCARLRAEPATREIPIVVLSAAEESEAMVAALEAGADDFLRKPLFAPELTAKIRTIARLNRYRAISAERDRFRWLLDHSLEPLMVVDQEGRLLFANERARVVFELSKEGGIDVVSALSRRYQAEPAGAWAAWRERRWPRDESFAIFQSETAQVAARWYKVEFHALDADASQTLIKFTNRTGAVRHELETYAFQHFISHKIRTPLNGLGPIFGFLESTGDFAHSPETAELLTLARESAERLESTLTGILKYHATLFPAERPARQPSLDCQLAEVVSSAAGSAGLAGLVTLDAPEQIACAPELVSFVLTEVLENYAKFSEAPKSGVRMSVARGLERWTLRLHAAGAALPAEVLAQLGRPYAQLERAFSGEVPGMGLGLARAKMLLRSHGGDLSFENHPEGGILTNIQLTLPSMQASPAHADIQTF